MVLKEQVTPDIAPVCTEHAAAPEGVDMPAPWVRRLALGFEVVALLAIVGLAGGLRFWDLEKNGWGTAYYTAAVRSGLESFKNAFYISADPGGHVCVDKPPVAIWVQILSAKLFGFSKLSVLGPQAAMGTLSVLILWWLVRRHFGRWAALLAALALAVMPISIAIDRSNNTDTCLAFVLLLSGWALLSAAERGNVWLLLLSMFLVGVAFNTKMLMALPVAPIFYLVYLLVAPVTWRSRFGDLALASFVLIVVSFSWAVAYDLTPEDDRPYADSTRNNSMLTLIVEHNGLERFVRRGRGPGAPGGPGASGPGATGKGPRTAPKGPADPAQPAADPADPAAVPPPVGGFPGPGKGAFGGGRGGPPGGGPGGAGPGGPPGRGGPGGMMGGTGWGGGSQVGPWRMAHPHMLGQTMWLFPLAVVGLVAAWFQAGFSWTLGPKQQAILLWSGWFGLYCVGYSFAGGLFHDYYVVTMAAPMAAMTGIGAVGLWRAFRDGGWASIFLPVALLVTALWQALAWLNYPFMVGWVVPTVLIAATATALGLLALRGSWWGLGLTVCMLGLVGWLWSRPSDAPDVVAAAETQLVEARKSVREVEGWDTLKGLYQRITPDLGSLVPSLQRQAPLVSRPLLIGCGIVAGCMLVVFVIARWRPAGTNVALGLLTVGYTALFLSPSLWAVTPLWGRTNVMLPAADAAVFEREYREKERRANDIARNVLPAMRVSLTATVSAGGMSDVLAAADLASGNAVQRARIAAGGARGPGGLAGFGGMPPPGGLGGPGAPPNPEAAEQQRKQREKMVAFLKANHNGERWHLAVNGINAASTLIIEEGLSVMPIGGFGNNPTLGSEPEQVKAKLAKLVENGEIRFFQVARAGPGGFGGGPGGRMGGPGAGRNPPGGVPEFVGPPSPDPPGGNPPKQRQPAADFVGPPRPVDPAGGAPPRPGPGVGNIPGMPGRGTATVGEWVREQAEAGKAKLVDRKLYTQPASQTQGRTPKGGFGGGGFGGPGAMGGAGDIYDLRPEIELKDPSQ